MLSSVFVSLLLNLVIPFHIEAFFAENLTQQTEYARRRVQNENVEPRFGVLYSKVAYIKWASKEETRLIKTFSARLKVLKQEVEIIKKYLSRHILPVFVKSSPDKFSSSPAASLQIHRIMGGYYEELATLRNLRSSKIYLQNRDELTQVLKETQDFIYNNKGPNGRKRLAPSFEDLWLTMESYFDVARVHGYQPAQLIYGFNPNQFNIKNGISLKVHHCIEIGMFALYREQHQFSVEWLEMIARKNSHFDQTTLFHMKDLASSLGRIAIQQHNSLQHVPPQMFYRNTFLNFYTTPIQEGKDSLQSRRDVIYNLTRSDSSSKSEISTFSRFWNICRRKSIAPPEVVKKLKCHYEKKRHPYLYINPVKVEHLSDTPPTYQLYEIIGKRRIQQLEQSFCGKVHPLSFGASHQIPRVRTGGVRLLLAEQVPHLMYKIPEAVTGLRFTGNTELFQFSEYTPGRYFDSHPDLLYSFGKESGNSRHDNLVATLLYYLEVPEVGGSTAMCQGGVRTNPAKGSAIVWINMYHNGTSRNDIDHGGCPVLEGHKITMNRWIRYLSNWDTFQCKLDQFV